MSGFSGSAIVSRSYLAGLTLSTAGASATFGVAVGAATDSTNIDVMTLASAFTKTTAAWAVGTGNGALDTGAIATSTWYHAHLIKRPDTGIVDLLISLSATAPTLPTNYSIFRRLGSMKTNGSSQWTLFTQNGDEFLWDVSLNDATSTNPGTAAVTRTLTVPTGVKVNAITALGGQSGSDSRGYASPLDVSDQAAGAGNINYGAAITPASGNPNVFMSVIIRTNTSAQIRTRNVFSDANTVFAAYTFGWIDTRGRLA